MIRGEEDGVLATVLFQRVYISNAGHSCAEESVSEAIRFDTAGSMRSGH